MREPITKRVSNGTGIHRAEHNRIVRDAVRRGFILAFGVDTAFDFRTFAVAGNDGIERACVAAVGRVGGEVICAATETGRQFARQYAWIARIRPVDGVSLSRGGYVAGRTPDTAMCDAIERFAKADYEPVETPAWVAAMSDPATA